MAGSEPQPEARASQQPTSRPDHAAGGALPWHLFFHNCTRRIPLRGSADGRRRWHRSRSCRRHRWTPRLQGQLRSLAHSEGPAGDPGGGRSGYYRKHHAARREAGGPDCHLPAAQRRPSLPKASPRACRRDSRTASSRPTISIGCSNRGSDYAAAPDIFNGSRHRTHGAA